LPAKRPREPHARPTAADIQPSDEDMEPDRAVEYMVDKEKSLELKSS
jgi:hypothetical protein